MTSQPGQHRRRMRTPTYALASPLGILSFFGLDEYSRLERKYAREVAEGTSNKDFESELKNVLKMGILDMRKGNYDKAESLFHIGLTMATDMQHQNGITYVLDLMANLALERKEYEKAERLFVNVMQRLIGLRGLSETDDAIVEMALKMASIHQGQGQHEKAEMGYSFCVHTQKAKLDELKAGGSTSNANSNAESDNTTALYGMSLDAHGRYLMDQGRVKAAKDRFETALAVSVGLYGEQSEQALAMSTGNLLLNAGNDGTGGRGFQEGRGHSPEAALRPSGLLPGQQRPPSIEEGGIRAGTKALLRVKHRRMLVTSKSKKRQRTA